MSDEASHLAEDARRAIVLTRIREGIGQVRAILEAMDAYDGDTAGQETGPAAAAERAALTLVPESAAPEAQTERERILAVMHASPGRTCWRSGPVAERLGRTDTAAVRREMDQMVAADELIKTSARGYAPAPETTEPRKETPAI